MKLLQENLLERNYILLGCLIVGAIMSLIIVLVGCAAKPQETDEEQMERKQKAECLRLSCACCLSCTNLCML